MFKKSNGQVLSLNEAYDRNRIVYLTNRLGEDTGFREIPPTWLEWYETLDREVYALLYLASIDGEGGVLAVYEFDECFHEDVHFSKRKYWHKIRERATELLQVVDSERFPVYLGKYSGFDRCCEIGVWFPYNTQYDEMKQVLLQLEDKLYEGSKS